MRVFTFSKQEEYQGSYSKTNGEKGLALILIAILLIAFFAILIFA